jgi:hypothetical protein
MHDRPFAVAFDPDGDRLHDAAAALQTITDVNIDVPAPQAMRTMIAMMCAVGLCADGPAAVPALKILVHGNHLESVMRMENDRASERDSIGIENQPRQASDRTEMFPRAVIKHLCVRDEWNIAWTVEEATV